MEDKDCEDITNCGREVIFICLGDKLPFHSEHYQPFVNFLQKLLVNDGYDVSEAIVSLSYESSAFNEGNKWYLKIEYNDLKIFE